MYLAILEAQNSWSLKQTIEYTIEIVKDWFSSLMILEAEYETPCSLYCDDEH